VVKIETEVVINDNTPEHIFSKFIYTGTLNNIPEHIFCKFIYTGTLNNTPEHMQIYIHWNTIYKCSGKNINNILLENNILNLTN
jgi:hypothetical protein